MKIVSWNVNGIRACAQKGFLSFLEAEQPDVLGVQETKSHPDQLPLELVAPVGWATHWSSAQRAGYSGVATFSKAEPRAVDYGIGIPKFDAEGRIVVTTYPQMKVYNIYFPNGGTGPERQAYKEEFLHFLLHHLRGDLKAGEKVAVIGDFNVAYLDHDVYDPVRLSTQSGFLPVERAWFREFLELGFCDTYRALHPDDRNKYSWWAYYENARISNRGWRIDHICVSNNLRQNLKRAEILMDKEGSDHCPVLAEFEF